MAQHNLVKAQQRTKQQVDKTRHAEEWKEGDQVLLSTRHLHTFAMHLPMKLKRRWVGPFSILKAMSPVVYRLDLPTGWQIHPTFHVNPLKAFLRHLEFEREVEPPLPYLWKKNWSTRSRPFSDIMAREPNANISSYGRATLCQSPHGSQKRISSMFQIS